MWSPLNFNDYRRHVEEAVLQLPIFFEGVDGRLGLSLEATALGRCHNLHNAQQFAPLGQNSTTHIRIVVSVVSRGVISVARALNLISIQWPGYKGFKRQVSIRDETSEHKPITVSRFAHHIGRSVDAFLMVRSSDLPRNTCAKFVLSLNRLVSRTLGLPTAGASSGRSGHMASSEATS